MPTTRVSASDLTVPDAAAALAVAPVTVTRSRQLDGERQLRVRKRGVHAAHHEEALGVADRIKLRAVAEHAGNLAVAVLPTSLTVARGRSQRCPRS